MMQISVHTGRNIGSVTLAWVGSIAYTSSGGIEAKPGRPGVGLSEHRVDNICSGRGSQHCEHISAYLRHESRRRPRTLRGDSRDRQYKRDGWMFIVQPADSKGRA